MKKLTFLFAVILFGCQQGGGPISQADKDAIQKNLDAFTEASNKNSDELGNGYADDLISMPPHAKEISGKQNVVAFHNDPAGAKTVSFTITTAEIEGNGDIAYARGAWTFKGTVQDSIEINDNGKYLLIFKKQADSSWKTIRETWNSDLPMPGQ